MFGVFLFELFFPSSVFRRIMISDFLTFEILPDVSFFFETFFFFILEVFS